MLFVAAFTGNPVARNAGSFLCPSGPTALVRMHPRHFSCHEAKV
jgi:heme A synthase